MKRPSAKWLWLMPLALFAVAHADRMLNTSPGNWRTASRAPVGLAPDPAATREAVVQVYAARAARWRGYFGVHTWIAHKATGAERFTVHEVISWRLRRSGSAVVTSQREPDGRWFGAAPRLLADVRGPGVERLIERIESVVEHYPYADRYRVWPGPNSNTFTATVLRAVPELRADLPPTAIGKDYLGPSFAARSPSGTGFQLGVGGVLGLTAGLEEGLELNLLGATFGVDPNDLSLKLPMAGRLGFASEAEAVVLH